ANKYPIEYNEFHALYGISQNPDTGDYNFMLEWIPYNQFNEIRETEKNGLITVYSAIWKDGPLYKKHWRNRNYTRDSNKKRLYFSLIWTSGNEKIDDFIQEKQLKVKNYDNIVLEWIPYNQFNKIKETSKNGLITVYSAIWKDGPLLYHGKHISISNIVWNITNPDTEDYILVFNWTSGNEKIDDFILERQLNINNFDDTVLEWIPYNQFNEIKMTGKNELTTVYSAIWKNGPLYKKNMWSNYIRDSNEEAKKYPIEYNEFYVLYGISQNPDTADYILVFNWTSGNEKIDDFILERQLNINNFDDIMLEWIPYNQFNEIERIGKMNLQQNIQQYGRMVHCVISMAKKNLSKHKSFQVLYGISQNPSTGNYILVLNWTSGNEKINNFIQERQLKINNYDDIVLEWIPYNQFNEIKETGKNGPVIVYLAVWKAGPLYKKYNLDKYYIRDSNKKVALKCLHNSQESVDSFINEANKYPIKYNEFHALYGISQNPDTGDYILVQKDNYIWISGNEIIDNVIQERQLNINDDDKVLEWIPYNQFNKIKETDKNGLITVYSAIWKDGPLKKDRWSNYTRNSNKEVFLKCLHNLQESIDSLISEAKKYSAKYKAFQVLYGISQNPDTRDYILVQNNSMYLANWISKNEKIDDFIQEMKINNYNSIVLEWIPFNQFNKIEITGKNDLITVYSAIWKDGPLKRHLCDLCDENYTRDSNKEVALKCIHNSQESIDSLINETKKYSIKYKAFQVLYGISQNPNTGDCILVFNWTSGNEKIDDFILKWQLNINNFDLDNIVLEWIPYNQFDKIKETGKNSILTTVYSAIWKDGPLHYQYGEYTRDSNKKVALKCLYNSQESIDSLINEAKKYSTYSTKHKAFQVLYGISQDPVTGDYILVFNWTSGNKNIDYLIQEMQLKINHHSDIMLEWIPYDQFINIKEIGKGGFAMVYSANWKNGPLEYNAANKDYKRNSNRVIALKCLHNSQNISDKFLNEVKKYSINIRSNILNIYGISQNPNTKEYIMVLQYAKEGNFNHWINENYKYFNWKDKLSALNNIINGLKEIHQNNIVHRDFHTGNILFLSDINEFGNCISISDMGLCGEVGNIDETKIYGVMPYVAPEVLRRKPYTKESDIYSLGMIMYFVSTGRQPFDNCAHDYNLALDICKGVRPEINEPEAPRCYIKLMKKCWDLNPNNRPNIFEVNELITSFYKLYDRNFFTVENEEIGIQFKKSEEYRKANLSFIKNYQITTHPQAIYTSRLLNPFTEDLPEYDDNSQCLDQVI
ncbi:unnamed protein product, partial [Rhizophagus irregularis]